MGNAGIEVDASGPTLRADLSLIHAPSVSDLREPDDTLFAYPSDPDSANVTSVDDLCPIGFRCISQCLRKHDIDTNIVNLASSMRMHTDINALLARLDAPVFGFGLHWMAQSHASIEIANRLEQLRPDALVPFGGISATYHASELIEYPGAGIIVCISTPSIRSPEA